MSARVRARGAWAAYTDTFYPRKLMITRLFNEVRAARDNAFAAVMFVACAVVAFGSKRWIAGIGRIY